MKVQLKTVDQKCLSIEIDGTATVLELKEKLVGFREIVGEHQQLKLIYNGQILKDFEKLATYKIDCDKIVVLLRQSLAASTSETPIKRKTKYFEASKGSIVSAATSSLPTSHKHDKEDVYDTFDRLKLDPRIQMLRKILKTIPEYLNEGVYHLLSSKPNWRKLYATNKEEFHSWLLDAEEEFDDNTYEVDNDSELDSKIEEDDDDDEYDLL